MLLADLGADVVKVEKLPGGDDTRSYDKPQVNGESAAFLAMNRNKRSIALDLKRPEGQAVIRRLIAGADVLVENFRKGTMEKFGLGYEALKDANPRLIYCAITGYGRTGPYADKGGFDLIAQGISGLMSITGEPGQEPVKCGPPVCDINAGMLGALGIVAAYVHRLKTGLGQMVDTSLLEAGIHTTFWHSAIFLATGVSPEPTGSAHVLSAPYQAFPTRDGWVTKSTAEGERMGRGMTARRRAPTFARAMGWWRSGRRRPRTRWIVCRMSFMLSRSGPPISSAVPVRSGRVTASATHRARSSTWRGQTPAFPSPRTGTSGRWRQKKTSWLMLRSPGPYTHEGRRSTCSRPVSRIAASAMSLARNQDWGRPWPAPAAER